MKILIGTFPNFRETNPLDKKKIALELIKDPRVRQLVIAELNDMLMTDVIEQIRADANSIFDKVYKKADRINRLALKISEERDAALEKAVNRSYDDLAVIQPKIHH